MKLSKFLNSFSTSIDELDLDPAGNPYGEMTRLRNHNNPRESSSPRSSHGITRVLFVDDCKIVQGWISSTQYGQALRYNASVFFGTGTENHFIDRWLFEIKSFVIESVYFEVLLWVTNIR